MLVEKDMSNQLDRLRIFFCLLLHIHQLIQHLFIKTVAFSIMLVLG